MKNTPYEINPDIEFIPAHKLSRPNMDDDDLWGMDSYAKRGFAQWSTHGLFRNKKTGKRVFVSDTPSGCGPTQLYGYCDIKSLMTLLPHLIACQFMANTWGDGRGAEEKEKAKRKYGFTRKATAFTFIQGIYTKPHTVKDHKEFIAARDAGFDIMVYPNVAHGITSDDVQLHCYLDLTRIFNMYNDVKPAFETMRFPAIDNPVPSIRQMIAERVGAESAEYEQIMGILNGVETNKEQPNVQI